jgi:hypothetical protein
MFAQKIENVYMILQIEPLDEAKIVKRTFEVQNPRL